MSWGYKIMWVFIAFVCGILFMVYTASKQTNEMEDEQYYVKELKYQDIIDAKNNLLSLQNKLIVKDSADVICIVLPSEASQNLTNSKMEFMRSSDKSRDVTIALEPDKNGRQLIDKNKFIGGQYKLRISWQSNDVPYYSEEQVYLK